jgi:hypothetical protein
VKPNLLPQGDQMLCRVTGDDRWFSWHSVAHYMQYNQNVNNKKRIYKFVFNPTGSGAGLIDYRAKTLLS